MENELFTSFRSKLEEKPDSLIFARLAELLYESGNADAAFALLEKGIAQNPTYITGYVVFGNLLLASQQYNKARNIYRRVLEIDPFNISVLSSLAQIEFSAGNCATATAHLMQILSIDPLNRASFQIIAQNWEDIQSSLPILVEEPREELQPVVIESVGGGVFSLIGMEPALEVKSLPLVRKETAVELTVLEHIVDNPPMEPVEVSEIEGEIEDIVEVDDFFKAFEAPQSIPSEHDLGSVPAGMGEILESTTTAEKTEIGESAESKSPIVSDIEVDLGYAAQVSDQAKSGQPAETEKPHALADEPLDWGIETEGAESGKSVEAADILPQTTQETAEQKIALDTSGDIFQFDTTVEESPKESEPKTESAMEVESSIIAETPPEIEVSQKNEPSKQDEREAFEILPPVKTKTEPEISQDELKIDDILTDKIFMTEDESIESADGMQTQVLETEKPSKTSEPPSEKPQPVPQLSKETTPDAEVVSEKPVTSEIVEDKQPQKASDKIELESEIFSITDETKPTAVVDESLASKTEIQPSPQEAAEEIRAEKTALDEAAASVPELEIETESILEKQNEIEAKLETEVEEASPRQDEFDTIEIENTSTDANAGDSVETKVDIPKEIFKIDGDTELPKLDMQHELTVEPAPPAPPNSIDAAPDASDIPEQLFIPEDMEDTNKSESPAEPLIETAHIEPTEQLPMQEKQLKSDDNIEIKPPDVAPEDVRKHDESILPEPQQTQETSDTKTEVELDILDVTDEINSVETGATDAEAEQPKIMLEKKEPQVESEIEAGRKDDSFTPPSDDIEILAGIETRSDSVLSAPEDVEQISGIDVRRDFTPPSDDVAVEQLDSLEKNSEASMEQITPEMLESLLDNDNTSRGTVSTDSREKPTAKPTSMPTPPKDIATATTAEIFAAQGMTQKAIEIYQRLLAKHDLSEEDRDKFDKRLELLNKRLKEK